MKKVLVLLLLLLVACGGAEQEVVISEASDIIPKSQVIWCNNEINKLQTYLDEIDAGVDIANKYPESYRLELLDSIQYFSTTTELFYDQPANTILLLIVKTNLNADLTKFPENLESLQEGADFCNSWYEAQS